MTARTKLTTTAALVAATAFLAPVAQAQHPDDRALKGPGSIEATQTSASRHPDSRADRGILIQLKTAVRPDDRAGIRGPGAIEQPTTGSTATRPDDRAGERGPGAFDRPTVVVAHTATDFDWGDAFVGAMGGIGMALLLTGALFLLLGQRTKARVA
jgi:uncharacterized iron-regulated membrane protein